VGRTKADNEKGMTMTTKLPNLDAMSDADMNAYMDGIDNIGLPEDAYFAVVGYAVQRLRYLTFSEHGKTAEAREALLTSDNYYFALPEQLRW